MLSIRNLSVQKKILLLIGILSVVSVAIFILGNRNLNTFYERGHGLYQQEMMGLYFVEEANTELLHLHRAEKNIILATSEEMRSKQKKDYERFLSKLLEDLAQAKPLFYTEKGKALVLSLEKSIDEWLPVSRRVISLAEAEGFSVNRDSTILSTGEGREKMNAVEGIIDDLAMIKKTNAEKLNGENMKDYDQSRIFLLSLLICGVGLGVFLGLSISKMICLPLGRCVKVAQSIAGGNMTDVIEVTSEDELGELLRALKQMSDNLRVTIQKVSDSANAVASGATQLSASAEEMSSTTDEIARGGDSIHSSTEAVAAAITQFSASIQQVAGNVRVSVSHSESAVQATEAGARGGEQMATSMGRIRETTINIAKAVQVIQDIARQTNLLSLNAAIEAAKAGSQGKGFAVVAEEVRKLAERSRLAAIQIEEMLTQGREAVDEGQNSVKATKGLLDDIQQAIGSMSSMVLEIGSATEEQSRTAVEVSKRVDAVTRDVGQNAAATQEMSATVQEIARTANSLAQVSEDLALAMKQFQV